MAFEAYDDYEQSERVQQWLRQNGVSIAVGIVLGLLLIFGWQQWKTHRANHRELASTQFQALQQALAANKATLSESLTDGLMKDYDDTAYASFAASLRAQRQLQAGHADKAAASLAWAQAHTDDVALKSLFTVRLARVQLAAGKAAEGLSTLKTIPDGDYQAISQELRGDALVKLGRTDQARTAYQKAMKNLEENTPQRAGLEVKLDNLPGANSAAVAKPAVDKSAMARPTSTGKQGA